MRLIDTVMVELLAAELHLDALYFVTETRDAPRLEMGSTGGEWVTAPRTTIEFVGFRHDGDCVKGRWDRTYDSIATTRTWTYVVHDDEVLFRTGDGSIIHGVLGNNRTTLCLGTRTYAVGSHPL